MRPALMDLPELNIASQSDGNPERVCFGFLLLPEFPLYGLVPAIEALRIANQNNGKKIYDWQLISETGGPVHAGNGVSLNVDATITNAGWLPIVLVFGGNHPTRHLSKGVLNWLRRLARHGSVVGGIDTGAFALAEAGLLHGRCATLHWESFFTFRELYPDIEVIEQLYNIDRGRITCAGGHATLDMMLDIISGLSGPALAQVVANAFVAHRQRDSDEPQRLDPWPPRQDGKSPLNRVLQGMEENIQTPLSATALADQAGVSVRALNRLVHDSLGDAPMSYYRKVRLQAARRMLFYSDLAIRDVAFACGFGSPEVFSRCFKAHFGVSPREYRRRTSSHELERYRPELRQELTF